MTKYTKDYCIKNNVIIECKGEIEAKKVADKHYFLNIKHTIYLVIKGSTYFDWQDEGNNGKFRDYFKQSHWYPNSETISASRYLQDNGLEITQTSTYWW